MKSLGDYIVNWDYAEFLMDSKGSEVNLYCV